MPDTDKTQALRGNSVHDEKINGEKPSYAHDEDESLGEEGEIGALLQSSEGSTAGEESVGRMGEWRPGAAPGGGERSGWRWAFVCASIAAAANSVAVFILLYSLAQGAGGLSRAISSPDGSSPAIPSPPTSPAMSLRSPHHRLLPNDRVAVCVNFNDPPRPAALDVLLTYQTQLHASLVVLSPAPYAELDVSSQRIFEAYPSVTYIPATLEWRGFCQQHSLALCLEHYANSSHRYDGVMYIADDAWFDWLEVLVPRCEAEDVKSKEEGRYASFTSSDPRTMRFRYPFDEFWFLSPSRFTDMHDERPTFGDWWFSREGFWWTYKASYWALPEQWRDWLSLVSGRKHYTLTTSAADVLYTPFHHGQLANLLTVLRFVNGLTTEQPLIPLTPPCPFSEAGMHSWVYLAMMMSGRPPLVPIPNNGALDDTHILKQTAWGNSKPYFDDWLGFLDEVDFRRRHGQAEASRDWQLRPVPFQHYGFTFVRSDYSLIRWITMDSGGDPIVAHPLKLNPEISAPAIDIYKEAHARLIRQLGEFEQRPDVRCRHANSTPSAVVG